MDSDTDRGGLDPNPLGYPKWDDDPDPDDPRFHVHADGTRHAHANPDPDPDPSLTYSGTHGYGSDNIFPDPQPDPVLLAHRIKFDRVRDGYQCRIDDAHGRAIVIYTGDLDLDPTDPDAFDFTVQIAQRGPGGRVLPLRPQPQPDANAVTYRDPPGVTTYVGDPPAVFPAAPVFAHAHRHPHCDPADAFRVAYWHHHAHRHPNPTVPAPRGGNAAYEHGGDAYLHDDHDHPEPPGDAAG